MFILFIVVSIPRITNNSRIKMEGADVSGYLSRVLWILLAAKLPFTDAQDCYSCTGEGGVHVPIVVFGVHALVFLCVCVSWCKYCCQRSKRALISQDQQASECRPICKCRRRLSPVEKLCDVIISVQGR